MKKDLRTIIFSFIALALISCEERHLAVTAETINIIPAEIELGIGDTMYLSCSFSPENAEPDKIYWKITSPQTVSVNDMGKITAHAQGHARIAARMGNIADTCNVTVVAEGPQIGDFYYSDGTWSTQPDAEKTAIGIVFWCGDPGKDDSMLRHDHPECTNGLAVAINGDIECAWQTGYAEYGETVSEWITRNAPQFSDILSGNGPEDNMNKILGYNNTKAIETFNAAPENHAWRIDAVEQTVRYRNEVRAPANCSGWYLPSLKELSLLCSGEYEGNIWGFRGVTSNKDLINARLTETDGADILESFPYWSSTEGDVLRAYYVNFEIGLPNFTYVKDTWYLRIRPILAF